jgi:hypothetical protein
MPTSLHRVAETLRALLACGDAAAFDARWDAEGVEETAWSALAGVAASTDPAAAPLLAEVDALLLRLLDHLPGIAGRGPGGAHLWAFRQPALERLQHATAAATVAHRFGPAGLAAVVGDGAAPLARRYHALLLLAYLHVETSWSLFERYLVPGAHHAFVGVAAEAARYYPRARPAPRLIDLFDAVRADPHLRAFLAPRILASLFVLADPLALPFYRGLAVSGHTHADPHRCEVTHALVMLRRLTGTLSPGSKFGDDPAVIATRLEEAAAGYERERDVLHPVYVI